MIAIVTGSSRGIGLAVAKALLARGDVVIGTARSENENTAALLSENGNFRFIKADISLEEDRNAVVKYAVDEFGRIDLLVNNAGVAPKVRKDMLEITEEDFDYVISVNLKGTYFMSLAAANAMIGKNPGRIVNISSVSSYAVSLNRAEYCIAKAGISMITKLFAARLAENGIGVFEIMPGIIETDMTAKVKDKYVERINGGLTPIKRMGKPEDVANCVLAVAEGRLDFGTGTQLNADGGFSVRIL